MQGCRRPMMTLMTDALQIHGAANEACDRTGRSAGLRGLRMRQFVRQAAPQSPPAAQTPRGARPAQTRLLPPRQVASGMQGRQCRQR